MARTLTEAQFEMLEFLQRDGMVPGDAFDADEMFPHRDNVDNGHRRTLIGLARKGYVVRVTVQDHPTITRYLLCSGAYTQAAAESTKRV